VGIGDELMAAGEARALHGRTSLPVKIRKQPEKDVRWWDIWDGLPYIARQDDARKCVEMAGKDGAGHRPYIARKSETQWIWKRYTPLPAEIAFTQAELAFGGQAASAILIEPHIKQSGSPNKNWGWARWQALVDLRPEWPWLQVGPAGVASLRGVLRIETPSFRLAAALLAQARAAVLPDGGLYHAAAAVGTPAIVIRGGFASPAVTGYATQRNLFVEDPAYPLGCGMRIRCEHCLRAMAAITPARVAAELEDLLEKLPRPVPA
jgi:hypothetical protein